MEWVKKPEPDEQGFYVVAIEYDSGLGTYGCSYWNSVDGWSMKNEGEKIVAHIGVKSLLDELKIPSPWDD